MPKITLTDLSVQKLKTPGTYWDAALPAFGVRIGKSAKTFILIRDGGRRIKLGRYPKISLQAARQKAISEDHDPNTAPRLTLEEGIKRYLHTHVRPNYRPRSSYNTERLLTLYSASLAQKPMQDLKSSDFTTIFDTLKPSEANLASRVKASSTCATRSCSTSGRVSKSATASSSSLIIQVNYITNGPTGSHSHFAHPAACYGQRPIDRQS